MKTSGNFTRAALVALLICIVGSGGVACGGTTGGALRKESPADTKKETRTSTSKARPVSAGSSPIAEYLRKRLADAGDIFSFSITGNVYGAKASVSKLGVGLYSTGASLLGPNRFAALVDCGHPFLWRGGHGKSACRSREIGLRSGVMGVHQVQEHTLLLHYKQASRAQGLGAERAESTGKIESKLISPLDSRNAEEWTQLNVSAGFIVGVHAGFNPGALVDFVLGWFGIDIMEDDVRD